MSSKPKPNTHADVKDLLNERNNTHGAFTENARLSQGFENLARTSKNWDLLTDVQKEGLKLDFHKTARFLSGNPNFLDAIKDKMGYNQLMLDEMQQHPDALDVKTVYFSPTKEN